MTSTRDTVLTDRGGYRLDKGLDEERGVEQPIGLLDDKEWQRLREGYRDANPFFEKADAFTLDKSGTLHAELLPRRAGEARPVKITPDGWSPGPASDLPDRIVRGTFLARA